jgi:hypothetical protein
VTVSVGDLLNGCFRLLGWVTLGFALLVLGMCSYLSWDEPRGRLPPQIEVRRVLASDSKIGGFLEGCVFAAYQISETSAKDLERRGLPAIEGTVPAKDSASNPYGPWRATPLAIDEDHRYLDPATAGSKSLFALGAAGRCQSRGARAPISAWETLRQPGSFYSITRNGEGLIVIDPKRRLAVWMYFG